MTVPSPESRRLTTPRWLDLRLVLGVALVLICVAVGAFVVSRADHRQPRVVATHDLAAGTVLRAGDVRVEQVQLPGAGVYIGSVHDAVGRQLTRGVAKGELVSRAATGATGRHTTLTVPFASGAAPTLRAGQRIEVWVSTASCASVVLLPDVTVQSVGSGSDPSFGSGGSGQNVVINVDPSVAGRVIAALAIDSAQIRAGVLNGPAAGAPVPSTAAPAPGPSGPGGQLPPDLAACAAPSR